MADAYKSALDTNNGEHCGAVTAEAIEKAEQAWLDLRAGWIKFGRISFPNLRSDRIHSRLTRQRIHQPRSLAR